jgi:hypothetical protein
MTITQRQARVTSTVFVLPALLVALLGVGLSARALAYPFAATAAHAGVGFIHHPPCDAAPPCD